MEIKELKDCRNVAEWSHQINTLRQILNLYEKIYGERGNMPILEMRTKYKPLLNCEKQEIHKQLTDFQSDLFIKLNFIKDDIARLVYEAYYIHGVSMNELNNILGHSEPSAQEYLRLALKDLEEEKWQLML